MDAELSLRVRQPTSPRDAIVAAIATHPALQALMVYLPCKPALRRRCEAHLADLFGRLHHVPVLTRQTAAFLVEHAQSRNQIIYDELRWFPDETEPAINAAWMKVISEEADQQVKDHVLYCIALLARLYRLGRRHEIIALYSC